MSSGLDHITECDIKLAISLMRMNSEISRVENDFTENELYDITEQIRSFYYHFDDNYFSNFSNQECKFKYFVEYIKDHENIKLNNCNLIAYMNDNDFTQRKFRIDDILEYTYKDLFYTN